MRRREGDVVLGRLRVKGEKCRKGGVELGAGVKGYLRIGLLVGLCCLLSPGDVFACSNPCCITSGIGIEAPKGGIGIVLDAREVTRPLTLGNPSQQLITAAKWIPLSSSRTTSGHG